mgnify:CR=1 FL=1
MASHGKSRLLSVDFMRGATVGGMILANNPGDTANVYRALLHAEWHGWTVVDLIFPIFLFLVGVSVALAVRRDTMATGKRRLWPHALKRAALLFLLGLLVNGFPYFHLETLRIPGVLQRIAIVYLAVLWLHLHLGRSGIAITMTAILMGYWLVWAFVPVPGLGFPTLDYEYNLEGWLDQMLMRGHIWEYDTSWDPEGILSTFPCVALGLLGVLAGRWLLREEGLSSLGTFCFGCAVCLGGLAWDTWFPINKNITTSSFVLFSGGIGVMLLAVLHGTMDGRPRRFWMGPFVALGKNALFVFVVSQLLTQILYITRVPWGGAGRKSLHFWLFENLFGFLDNRYVASIAWAIGLTVVLTTVAMVLERRGIVVKL